MKPRRNAGELAGQPLPCYFATQWPPASNRKRKPVRSSSNLSETADPLFICGPIFRGIQFPLPQGGKWNGVVLSLWGGFQIRCGGTRSRIRRKLRSRSQLVYELIRISRRRQLRRLGRESSNEYRCYASIGCHRRSRQRPARIQSTCQRRDHRKRRSADRRYRRRPDPAR